MLSRYTRSKSVNVEAVLYLTFLVDPTAIKPKLTTKPGVRPEGTSLRKKVVNWHARCDDVSFKCIGFPTAKRPNLGAKKTFISRVTSAANSKAVPLISACIYLDRKISSSHVIRY